MSSLGFTLTPKTTLSQRPFSCEQQGYDATLPFAVVANIRSFNRVVGRYADEAQVVRRARDLSNRYQDR